jgi:hypothetical protein
MTRNIGSRQSARQSAMQSSIPASFEKRLTWVEPGDFRKSGVKVSRNWMVRIIGLTAVAVVVFIGIADWFYPGAEVTRNVSIAGGGIVMMILVLFFISRMMRIVVKITDKAIVCELDEPPTVYRFKTIDHCEIGNMVVGSRTHSVLVIELKNGDREIFGVASSVSKEVLRLTLEQRGVNIVNRSDTLNERALLDESEDPYSHQTGIRRDGRST